MDSRKVVICRCEDVTLQDVLDAINQGYTNIELLKRKLRIGMGPCQGRYCIPLLVKILSRNLGKRPEELGLPKVRPPLTPLEAKYFIRGRS